MDNKKILLVEDNPDDEAIILRTLRRYQVTNEVEVAHDGAEALDYLFANGKYAARDAGATPAIVLLDLKLPKIDGLEVLRRIRAAEATRLTRVVVLTSSEQEEDLVNSYRFGCNSFVRKPVAFADFAEAVRQLGLYWLILNEPPPDAEGTAK